MKAPLVITILPSLCIIFMNQLILANSASTQQMYYHILKNSNIISLYLFCIFFQFFESGQISTKQNLHKKNKNKLKPRKSFWRYLNYIILLMLYSTTRLILIGTNSFLLGKISFHYMIYSFISNQDRLLFFTSQIIQILHEHNS